MTLDMISTEVQQLCGNYVTQSLSWFHPASATIASADIGRAERNPWT
jgi:hypothetical protein